MPEITKNQLKHIRLLKQKKYRQEFGEFLVEGEKNVDELLKSNFKVIALYATQEWDNTNCNEEITLVTTKQLSQISNLSSPNKVLALDANCVLLLASVLYNTKLFKAISKSIKSAISAGNSNVPSKDKVVLDLVKVPLESNPIIGPFAGKPSFTSSVSVVAVSVTTYKLS